LVLGGRRTLNNLLLSGSSALRASEVREKGKKKRGGKTRGAIGFTCSSVGNGSRWGGKKRGGGGESITGQTAVPYPSLVTHSYVSLSPPQPQKQSKRKKKKKGGREENECPRSNRLNPPSPRSTSFVLPIDGEGGLLLSPLFRPSLGIRKKKKKRRGGEPSSKPRKTLPFLSPYTHLTSILCRLTVLRENGEGKKNPCRHRP